MTELAEKIALVVGDDEIGRGIAKRFSRSGATARVLDPRSIEDAPECDILAVNTLGSPPIAPLETQTDAAFDTALHGVTTAAAWMRRALPAMKQRGGGRIILIGHRYGECVHEGIGPYNAAAYALIGLMRTAAVDWGRYGITTNLLLPLAETTELSNARQKRPQIIDLLTSQVAMKRIGDPVEDIGGAALFLAADGAFVNGQILHADGGQHIAAPVLSPIRFASSN